MRWLGKTIAAILAASASVGSVSCGQGDVYGCPDASESRDRECCARWAENEAYAKMCYEAARSDMIIVSRCGGCDLEAPRTDSYPNVIKDKLHKAAAACGELQPNASKNDVANWQQCARPVMEQSDANTSQE